MPGGPMRVTSARRTYKTELYHKLKQLNQGIRTFKQHARCKSLSFLTNLFEQASKSKSKVQTDSFLGRKGSDSHLVNRCTKEAFYGWTRRLVSRNSQKTSDTLEDGF